MEGGGVLKAPKDKEGWLSPQKLSYCTSRHPPKTEQSWTGTSIWALVLLDNVLPPCYRNQDRGTRNLQLRVSNRHTFLPPSKQSPQSTCQVPGTRPSFWAEEIKLMSWHCQRQHGQCINMDISQYNCCCHEETSTQSIHGPSGCSKISTLANGPIPQFRIPGHWPLFLHICWPLPGSEGNHTHSPRGSIPRALVSQF